VNEQNLSDILSFHCGKIQALVIIKAVLKNMNLK
jgi:hypothetical protein